MQRSKMSRKKQNKTKHNPILNNYLKSHVGVVATLDNFVTFPVFCISGKHMQTLV